MAFTRFKYDDCRTKKQLQQSTDPGRWILNVPGNGSKPCYVEDPQIIIQKWGANLRTNTVNLESELLGINKPISRDCLGKDNYVNFKVDSREVEYPSCNNLYTEQSRAITPAWMVRDEERNLWGFPVFNPQQNVCFSFQNNLSTRILEKDYITPKRDCFINDVNNTYALRHFSSALIDQITTMQQNHQNQFGIDFLIEIF
jgi:hypothetical protein